MKFQLSGERETIEAIEAGLLQDGQVANLEVAKPIDADRLGLEFGDVVTIVGSVVTGWEAIKFAQEIINATRGRKRQKVELSGPNGKVEIDVAGKSKEDVAKLVEATLKLLD